MTLDDIKKLSPKERLKKLKELQEKDQKELKEAEKLIKQSIHDAEQEEIEDIVRRIKKPELRKVKVEELFDEKQESIENKVVGAKPSKTEEERKRNISYNPQISERVADYNLARPETYDKVKELVEKSYDGSITQEEEQNLNFYENKFRDVNPDYMEGEERSVVEKTETLFSRLRRYQ